MTSSIPKLWQAATLASLLAIAGCGGEQTDPPDEPSLETVVLGFNQAIEIEGTAGNGFGNPTVTTETGSVLISSAEFLMADGEPDPIVNELDFRLAVAGDAAGGALPDDVTFARNGSFTGTIVGIPAGESVQVFISLYHVRPAHNDFGPFPITISRPGGGGGGGGPVE